MALNDSNNDGYVDEAQQTNSVVATSPDDIQTKINNLPTHGGYVKLLPNSYTDADWTSRIDIPDIDNSQYMIDMRGSTIDLDSFSPSEAYIKKPLSGTNKDNNIWFYGPSEFDVVDVANPPAFLELNDIDNSNIVVPLVNGNVDYIVRNIQDNGSGHMNKMWVRGFNIESGFYLEGQSVSNDRSFYWGQINNFEQSAVECVFCADNHFYVQPENSKSGFTGTGYDLDSTSHDNHIWITHSGPEQPLNVEGQRNSIHYPIRTGPRGQNFQDSIYASRPSMWKNGDYQHHRLPSAIDNTSMMNTVGDGSVSINPFNATNVDAGATDGNVQQYATASRLGNFANGYLTFARINPRSTANRKYRFGVINDNGRGAYWEADSSDGNSNWVATTKDDGDNETTTESSFASDGTTRELQVYADENAQRFYIDQEFVTEMSTDLSAISVPQRMSFEVEVVGSPGDNIDGLVNSMEWMAKL